MAKFDTSFNFGANAKPKKSGTKKSGKEKAKKGGSGKGYNWQASLGKK